MAAVLGVTPEELLPDENPAFEMKVRSSGLAWVRVNRQVSLRTALKIAEIVEGDSET